MVPGLWPLPCIPSLPTYLGLRPSKGKAVAKWQRSPRYQGEKTERPLTSQSSSHLSHTRTQQGFWVCRATTELPCRKLFRPQIGQSAGRFSNGPTDLVARACLVRPHLTHLTHLTHGTAAGLQAGGPLSSLQLRGWLRLRVGAFAAHGSWSVRRRGLPVPQVIAPDGLALSVVRRSPTPAARPRTLICVVVTAEDSASFFVFF